MTEPLLSIAQRIAHERETVRAYERAEEHIGGTCQCDADVLSEECADALNVACAMAEMEVLTAFQVRREHLELHIQRLELEQRIEVLENWVGVAPALPAPAVSTCEKCQGQGVVYVGGCTCAGGEYGAHEPGCGYEQCVCGAPAVLPASADPLPDLAIDETDVPF